MEVFTCSLVILIPSWMFESPLDRFMAKFRDILIQGSIVITAVGNEFIMGIE